MSSWCSQVWVWCSVDHECHQYLDIMKSCVCMKSPRENESRERTKERSPKNCELEAYLVVRNRNTLKLDQVKKWHGMYKKSSCHRFQTQSTKNSFPYWWLDVECLQWKSLCFSKVCFLSSLCPVHFPHALSLFVVCPSMSFAGSQGICHLWIYIISPSHCSPFSWINYLCFWLQILKENPS